MLGIEVTAKVMALDVNAKGASEKKVDIDVKPGERCVGRHKELHWS
jgi:hypothetical protein